MKKNILYFILFYPLYSCIAQSNIGMHSDSLGLISRKKADIILSHFDTIYETKILYTLLDKDYYIIVQDNDKYKEYYISVDSLDHIKKFKEISLNNNCNNLKKTKDIERRNEEVLIITKAFDLTNYHTNFITQITNPTLVTGAPSYFVIKDKNGKRYGEYSLSAMVAPSPIDPKLWIYLFRELVEVMEK